MKKIATVFLVLCSSFGLLGCGSNEDDEGNRGDRDESTYLRFINGVPDVQGVDFRVNGEPYFENVRYLGQTGYFKIDSEDQELRVVVSRSFTTLYDRETSLNDDADQTLIVYGPSENPKSLLLDDENEAPGDDVVKIRVINLMDSLRAADVYVVERSVSIDRVAPTADALGFGEVSEYFTSDAGTYRIAVTARDSKEVLAELSGRQFDGDIVYTILVADTAPGRQPPRIIVLSDRS